MNSTTTVIKKKATNVNKQKIIHSINLKNLPEDIIISTMTIVCKVETEFKVDNIGKYIDLSYNNIISVRYGSSLESRSLLPKKKEKEKKKKKKKKNFYNQVSVVIKPKKNNPINVKLFNNGSIQMTGCKSLENAVEVLGKLFDKLKTVKAIVDPITVNKVIEKPFVTNYTNLSLGAVKDFRIAMINSNFNIGFKIDRDKLYGLLLENDFECTYDPIMHACVNIKHVYSELKNISIFVFESGAIIITGANSCDHITSAYNFINKYLLSNYKEIVKSDMLTNSTILMYLKNDDENSEADIKNNSGMVTTNI
ncbi:MAG: TATA box binding protein [Edafosvirus sp.]|uniref:TATA box binding protein n=1 Tax=Edafosvirus sp. TaxID=2487765 RepID=A0A3G4ZZ76_9VIRU|nr:MAG: TATA box binding protein [Edafosvirus sp.]